MRLLSLFLLLNLVCFSQTTKSDWKLKKNENGIVVYSRKTASSDFRELKSILYLKTSLNSIVALINDRASYPQWVYKCGQATVLKKISESELIHYQTVTAPWPAKTVILW